MLRKHWSANGPPSYLKGNPNSLPEDALLLAAFKSLLANAGAGDVLQTDKVPSSESRFPIFEPRNSESLPVGHSLYAILVLRNMSRAIRSAIVPVKQSKDDQVLSYLTPFGETEDDPTDTFVHGASQGKDAILQMEEELLNLAMNSRILGSYLGDIMGDIAAIRKTLMSSAHQPAT